MIQRQPKTTKTYSNLGSISFNVFPDAVLIALWEPVVEVPLLLLECSCTTAIKIMTPPTPSLTHEHQCCHAACQTAVHQPSQSVKQNSYRHLSVGMDSRVALCMQSHPPPRSCECAKATASPPLNAIAPTLHLNACIQPIAGHSSNYKLHVCTWRPMPVPALPAACDREAAAYNEAFTVH